MCKEIYREIQLTLHPDSCDDNIFTEFCVCLISVHKIKPRILTFCQLYMQSCVCEYVYVYVCACVYLCGYSFM